MICPKYNKAYKLTIKIIGKLHKAKAECGCGKVKLEWTEATSCHQMNTK